MHIYILNPLRLCYKFYQYERAKMGISFKDLASEMFMRVIRLNPPDLSFQMRTYYLHPYSLCPVLFNDVYLQV